MRLLEKPGKEHFWRHPKGLLPLPRLSIRPWAALMAAQNAGAPKAALAPPSLPGRRSTGRELAGGRAARFDSDGSLK